MKSYKNVDEYIANFPEEAQKGLKEIMKIKEEAPEAGEPNKSSLVNYFNLIS